MTVLHHQGEPVRLFERIVSGHVALIRLGSGGREDVVAMLARGCYLGLEQFTHQNPQHTYDVRAVLDAVLESVTPTDDLMVFGLARQLEAVYTQMLERHYPVERRIALTLLRLAKEKYPDSSGEISLELTQDNLALLVGIAREHVNKVLGQFKRAGLVETQRYRRLAIVRLEGIRAIAEGR